MLGRIPIGKAVDTSVVAGSSLGEEDVFRYNATRSTSRRSSMG